MVQIKVGRGNPPLVEPSASAQSDDLIKSTHNAFYGLGFFFFFSGNGLDSANEGQIVSFMPRLALGGMPGQEKLNN